MTPTARVTGFGPFGAVVENPSSVVAASLAAGLSARGWSATAETLPVTFDAAAEAPARMLASATGPIWLLHVGVAERRSVISLERTAKNVAGARAGVDGVSAATTLDADGPATRFTTIDLARLAAAVRAPFDVEVSDDAGDYVCNATYYASLAAVAERADGHALFIHVPPMSTEQARAVGEALADAIALTCLPAS